jgi:phage-related minor tail protein
VFIVPLQRQVKILDVGNLFVSLGLDMANFRTGLENAQRQLQTVGKKMSDIGEKMSVGITAPLTLAGGLMLLVQWMLNQHRENYKQH